MSYQKYPEPLQWQFIYVSFLVRKCIAEQAERLGVTVSQALTLCLLQSTKAHDMRSLADVIGCDASNITVVSRQLEKMEYVTISKTTQDLRVRQLILTAKGTKLRKDILNAAMPRIVAQLQQQNTGTQGAVKRLLTTMFGI